MSSTILRPKSSRFGSVAVQEDGDGFREALPPLDLRHLLPARDEPGDVVYVMPSMGLAPEPPGTVEELVLRAEMDEAGGELDKVLFR